ANTIARHSNTQRLDRINEIYSSLNLSNEYAVQSSDVFGEKRVYAWDKERTKASTITYIRGETVSNTVAELDAKIKAAGFTYVETEQLASKRAQYQYKSPEGEYVHLRVASKPYRDALENASAMSLNPQSETIQNMDRNAGPSRV